MIGDQVRPELARSWQKALGKRGGATPESYVPVIVLDDMTSGPYPPCRQWARHVVVNAVAAQFSFAILKVEDIPQNADSVTIVDRIEWRTSVADDVIVTVSSLSAVSGTPGNPVFDTAPEPDPTASSNPAIGNVTLLGTTSVGAIAGVRFPGNDLLPHIIQGPWIIAPGMALHVMAQAANELLLATFVGRFYAGA